MLNLKEINFFKKNYLLFIKNKNTSLVYKKNIFSNIFGIKNIRNNFFFNKNNILNVLNIRYLKNLFLKNNEKIIFYKIIKNFNFLSKLNLSIKQINKSFIEKFLFILSIFLHKKNFLTNIKLYDINNIECYKFIKLILKFVNNGHNFIFYNNFKFYLKLNENIKILKTNNYNIFFNNFNNLSKKINLFFIKIIFFYGKLPFKFKNLLRKINFCFLKKLILKCLKLIFKIKKVIIY